MSTHVERVRKPPLQWSLTDASVGLHDVEIAGIAVCVTFYVVSYLNYMRYTLLNKLQLYLIKQCILHFIYGKFKRYIHYIRSYSNKF